MNTLILNVSGMTCMGCVQSVKNLVGALPGVNSVAVDLTSGRVEVAHDPALATLAAIHASITAAGFQVNV